MGAGINLQLASLTAVPWPLGMYRCLGLTVLPSPYVLNACWRCSRIGPIGSATCHFVELLISWKRWHDRSHHGLHAFGEVLRFVCRWWCWWYHIINSPFPDLSKIPPVVAIQAKKWQTVSFEGNKWRCFTGSPCSTDRQHRKHGLGHADVSAPKSDNRSYRSYRSGRQHLPRKVYIMNYYGGP